MSERELQCPCGYKIKSESDYNILFLKKELNEIDILCPNPTCYLGELGFIKFTSNNGTLSLELARFYSPYVTWNATKMGEDETVKIMKGHLRRLIEERIDWNMILKESKRTMTTSKEGSPQE